jgi:hypothetical protein
MIEFVDPWAACPGCHQEYQNELAIDIANKFVPFVRRQYPDDTPRQVESLHLKLAVLIGMLVRLQLVSFVRRQYPDDTPKQAVSIYMKLRALMGMLGRLQPLQKIEAGVTANVLLSMIDLIG